jgi:hypothetical protein
MGFPSPPNHEVPVISQGGLVILSAGAQRRSRRTAATPANPRRHFDSAPAALRSA